MGTFLFLLLFFFVLWPLGRAAWALWRQYRMVKDHMRRASEMQDAFNRARGGAGSREAQQPRPRKKKIDPSVGEYVAFEEIRTFNSDSETSGRDASTQTPPASQVEDADWVDL